MHKNLVDDFTSVALGILQRHGHPATSVEYLGVGEQSVCYGAGEVALLIHQGVEIPDVRQANPYLLQHWMTAQAVCVRGKTAEYLGGIRGWLQSIKNICDTTPN